MRNTLLMLAVAAGLGLAAPTATPASGPRIAEHEGRSRWIVLFDEPAAATFAGFADHRRKLGLEPTSAAATGERRYDARSAAAREYVDYLDEVRTLHLADIATAIGRPATPFHTYEHALNGVSIELDAAEAARIATLPGVRSVRRDVRARLLTNHSAGWINADDLWNGAVPGVGSHRGAGVVVGIIDGGANRGHTMFAGTGISNPLGSVRGFCELLPAACNTKLIGLWDFVGAGDGRADPTDDEGHGTHVASTAAGNRVSGYGGMAPAANLIVYKACPDTGCDGSAMLASVDQAVADGVDVINMSIGGSAYDPWAEVETAASDVAEAFLVAREAGIVVAVAAGNSGPTPGTLSWPSNSPWVISVGNGNDGRSAALTDVLDPLSGRGPVLPMSVLKPDVVAPGENIIAAGPNSATHRVSSSGTSMASPHVAGAAALLLSAKPAWTADQVVSALTLTARPSVLTGPGVAATPHDAGGGWIDVAQAVRAGLYQPITGAEFRAARLDPFGGGAHQLNVGNLAHGACFATCTLTRTFAQMPGAAATTWTVTTTIDAGATITPSATSFASAPGGSGIDFAIDVSAPALAERWVYGQVTLTPADGGPALRLPIAVYASPFEDFATATTLASVERDVDGDRGFLDLAIGGMAALPDARFLSTALVAPTTTTQTIPVDSTPNDRYDNLGVNYVRLVTVPANAAGIRYRIGASTRAASPDIDLFIGRDVDGDGLPEASEQLCSSTSSESAEDCSIDVVSTGSAQTVWVMAQNWSGPGTGVAVTSHVVAMVDGGAAGGLVATGPGHVPAGAPFAIRMAWDDPSFVPGSERVGYLFIQHTDGQTLIETPVRLRRNAGAHVAYALAPGVARRVVLPAASAHERLFVDIPPGTTQATFRTTGSGDVTLYAAPAAIPAGPVVAAAPARNAAGVRSNPAAGANDTVVVANPTAGRWYLTPVNDGAAVAEVDVVATLDTVAAVPALRRGAYYNPARGGHGIFVYPSGPDHALLWYTYLQDGTPTWYYAQGSQPGPGQVWNGAVYRAAWNGSSRTLEAVGNIVLTPSSATTVTMSYNIDGFTGSESLDTFLTGCPTVDGTPLDVSAHWFDTVSPGYGYSVQVHPGYEFLATFVYDGIGVPRFLTAERGGAFAAGDNPLPLDQLAGFAPLGAYSAPVRTTVGTLTRTYGTASIANIGTTATFVNGVPGTWARNAAVTRLSDLPQGCTP